MKSPKDTELSAQAVADALGSITLPNGTGQYESHGQADLKPFLSALTQRHTSVLRYRRDVLAKPIAFDVAPIDWYRLAKRSIELDRKPSRQLSYASGDYYLQDAGSLLALAACHGDQDDFVQRLEPADIDSGPLICDLCAAPGGKATALVEAIGERGFVLANEPIRGRIAPLMFNLARTGSDRYAVSSLDPDKLANALAGTFDLVLVDAPCSGQALLGRGKQTLSALSMKQIELNAARQQRIIAAAMRLLRIGGRLVYSTCTFAEAENESQVRRLIDRGDAIANPIDSLAEYASGDATYRLWPHQHDCAGSFAASLTKVSDDEIHFDTTARKRKSKRDRIEKLPVDLSQWYDVDPSSRRIKVSDSVVYSWPGDVPQWVTTIASLGPEVAHRTGRVWKPAHAGALLRTDNQKSLATLDVDAQTAKQFFSGSPISCEQDGWQVVRFDSRPIGWVKGTRGAGKNHLPTAARFTGELV